MDVQIVTIISHRCRSTISDLQAIWKGSHRRNQNAMPMRVRRGTMIDYWATH